MRSAYLTIDDSASDRMGDLVSFLHDKGIPAVFFCRGDMLEKNPAPAVDAVKKGFVLANHTHTHQRAAEKDVSFTIAEIEHCDSVLQGIYQKAGVAFRHKYFRYPHVDRGAGAWIVDYDACDADTRAAVLAEITAGVNAPALERPAEDAFAKMAALQDYLHGAGYTVPFENISHDWYGTAEIARARDCLFTFSNADWMLNERQKGKWPYKSVDDLKQKARTDPYLSQDGGTNIVLAHDQADIVDVTLELISDLADGGLNFLEV